MLLGDAENPIIPDELTRKLIHNLAAHDPILRAILMLHYNDNLDWQQALIYMVYMKCKGEVR